VHVATQYASVPLLPLGAQAPRAPPSRCNITILFHAEYSPTLAAAAALRVKAAPSKAVWWPWLWPFDRESGIRVTCDVGYLCVNFGLPRPLCSRLRPDVCDRQTDRRQTDRQRDIRCHTKASLNAPPIRAGA